MKHMLYAVVIIVITASIIFVQVRFPKHEEEVSPVEELQARDLREAP